MLKTTVVRFLFLLLLLALVPASAAAAQQADVLPQRVQPCPATAPLAPPALARAAADGPSVRAVVRDAAAGDHLTPADAERYEAIYTRALAARAKLTGQRRAELAAVVAQLEAFARGGTLTVSRMPALFLQLDENTSWWLRHAPPAPPKPKPGATPCAGGAGQGGARVVRDEIVLQWYAGQGLQLQQLATAGRANALVKACIEPNPELACDRARVKTAMDGLAMLAVDRGGFRAWEYYFGFGGGRPPWISGLAQGTAMQALSRGAHVLGDPAYLDVARSALGAFERRPPAGVRVPAGAGNHYLIYSFNPGLRVFNAFTQSLVGLYDYAEAADDDTARALFAAGERRLREELPGADTGAWSRYSAGGAESDLGYHKVLRDFLRSLCDRTKRAPYCSAADRFTRYLSEPPKMRFLPASRARARAGTFARFSLTKVSCVTLKVTRGGKVVASRSAVLGRGARALGWVPPSRGAYRVVVTAQDLAGHRASIAAAVRAG